MFLVQRQAEIKKHDLTAPYMFLVQRQAEIENHGLTAPYTLDAPGLYNTEEEVTEQTQAEIANRWSDYPYRTVIGAENDGDTLCIYNFRQGWREVILCDDFSEMTQLYYALVRRPDLQSLAGGHISLNTELPIFSISGQIKIP